MSGLISVILIIVYFWQGCVNEWMILAASIFGIAGAIVYAVNKIEDIIKTKTMFEIIAKDKSIYEIKDMLNGASKSDSDISWFKHRDS